MGVKVGIYRRAGRDCYEAQWVDPLTGKTKTKSTGEETRKEAAKFAAKLEAEIEAGRHDDRRRVLWSEFRARYEMEVIPALAEATGKKIRSCFNAVEALISPRYLDGLTSEQISRFQKGLRDLGRTEATIKSILAHLKAALRWAQPLGLLATVPTIRMPSRVAGMKGRAPTVEEFERIKAKVPEVAACQPGSAAERSWLDLLEGLWWSGLRLAEALTLHWTDDRYLCVDLTGRRPMFRIQAKGQKNHTFKLLPMAPDFAERLARVPQADRHGFVFDPQGERDLGPLSIVTIGRMISEMGEKAGVKVAERQKTVRGSGGPGQKTTVVKYASAHDYRRAFGFRWSQLVMPAVLQEMMRHESYQTTMEFYVGRNADATADAIWDAFSTKSTDKTTDKPVSAENPQVPETPQLPTI